MIPKLILLLITIAKLPLHFIYLLSYFTPRNNKKWVFSTWEGKAYRGSSRYLYEYVSKNETIESIWITKNKKLYQELSFKGIKFDNKKNRYIEVDFSEKTNSYKEISTTILREELRKNLFKKNYLINDHVYKVVSQLANKEDLFIN